jgi:hypothetical protein
MVYVVPLFDVSDVPSAYINQLVIGMWWTLTFPMFLPSRNMFTISRMKRDLGG